MSGSGAQSGWSRLRRAPSGPSDRALYRFVGWYAAGLRLWIAVLSGAVVLADASVIVAMIVVHHLVVPAALIPAGTTWMLPLASTAIYISQFAFPAQAGLPVAAVVTTVYATTVPHPAGALSTQCRGCASLYLGRSTA